MATPRTTMSDVARAAGVSLMTVSRVVNNKEDVSSETRQKVLQVIEELNFRPSGIARSLATQRTSTLGLIVPDVSNPYFSGIAHGVAEVAYAEGFSVLLCDSEEQPERELSLMETLEDKRVDGVISCASRLDTEELHQVLRRFPEVALINRLLEDPDHQDSYACVLNDDKLGGYQMISHLLKRGHTAIGLLAGPPKSYGGQRRRAGHQLALEEAGLKPKREWILSCAPTVEGGRAAAQTLLQAHPELTALYCYNDMIAIGALQACLAMDIQVPGDLAIAGYDDIPMATWVHPDLTTCRVNFSEMGRQATRLLIKRLEGCDEGCERLVLEPEPIIRGSAP